MSVDTLYETMGLTRIVELDPAGRAVLEYEARLSQCHSGGVVQGGFVTGWIDEVERQSKRSVRRVVAAGMVGSEQLRAALEPQTGALVEELRPEELSAGNLTGSAIAPGLLAGVAGALVTR